MRRMRQKKKKCVVPPVILGVGGEGGSDRYVLATVVMEEATDHSSNCSTSPTSKTNRTRISQNTTGKKKSYSKSIGIKHNLCLL